MATVDDDISDEDGDDVQVVPRGVMLCEALTMLRGDIWLGLRVVGLLVALFMLLRRPDLPAPPPPPAPPVPPAPPQPAPPSPPRPPRRPPPPIPPPSVPAPLPPPPPPWWYPPPPSPSPSGPPDPPPPPQHGTTVPHRDHGPRPPPPPPRLPVMDDGQVLAELNERFAAGLGPSQRLRPGTALATLGVLLRLFDRTEDRLAPWRSCPAPPFTPAQLDSIRLHPGYILCSTRACQRTE